MVRMVHRTARRLAPALLLAALPGLSGCNMVVLNAAGDIARQQGDLVLISTGLMLLIILPVMALTVLFAWRYRAANRDATYDPEWDHSTQLELVIWAAPLMIIICLGAVTWVATHLLDPYRPLARIAPARPVNRAAAPLEVEVVALDWKWLFIYPEQGVATVNELAAPLNRPLHFRISASSVMNSFYVPALAGQIYAMPGMQTQMHAVFNRAGSFDGFSANYSGAGFSHMRFKATSMTEADFARWVSRLRAAGGTLDRQAYLKLEKPSEKEPARRFATVEKGLFDAIVNMCAAPGKMCMNDMMAIDARGGLPPSGAGSVERLSYDKLAARSGVSPTGRTSTLTPTATALCSPSSARETLPTLAPRPNLDLLQGAGLARPEARPSSSMTAAIAATPPMRPES